MKAIIITIFVLLPFVANAEGHFDQYFGCYQTKSVNQRVVESDNPLETEIAPDTSPFLDAETRTQIPAIKFFIYLGKFSDGHHMQLSYLPPDRGLTISDEFGDHYSFDDKIRFTTNPDKVFNLHIKIDFKKVGQDLLELTVFNQFDEVGAGATTHFLLLKTTCSDDLVKK